MWGRVHASIHFFTMTWFPTDGAQCSSYTLAASSLRPGGAGVCWRGSALVATFLLLHSQAQGEEPVSLRTSPWIHAFYPPPPTPPRLKQHPQGKEMKCTTASPSPEPPFPSLRLCPLSQLRRAPSGRYPFALGRPSEGGTETLRGAALAAGGGAVPQAACAQEAGLKYKGKGQLSG